MSDGNEAGTVMVSDLNPGKVGSGPASIAAVGGWVLFTAKTPSTGRELWSVPVAAAG